MEQKFYCPKCKREVPRDEVMPLVESFHAIESTDPNYEIEIVDDEPTILRGAHWSDDIRCCAELEISQQNERD